MTNGDDRERIITALRNLAPGHPIGRIWGRLADATAEQAQEGNAWAADVEDVADLVLAAIGKAPAADVDTQPAVRLISAVDGQHIEVWHVPQPERYRVTRETWVDEPGHLPVRHVYAVREADTP